MTKAQQIGHIKKKRQTHLILSLIIYVSYQKPAFMVIVELDRKQNGKKHGFHVHVDKRPTLVKCQKMSDFLKANTCMTIIFDKNHRI